MYIITSMFSANRVGTGPMMLSLLNMVQTRGHSFTSTVGTLSLKQKNFDYISSSSFKMYNSRNLAVFMCRILLLLR